MLMKQSNKIFIYTLLTIIIYMAILSITGFCLQKYSIAPTWISPLFSAITFLCSVAVTLIASAFTYSVLNKDNKEYITLNSKNEFLNNLFAANISVGNSFAAAVTSLNSKADIIRSKIEGINISTNFLYTAFASTPSLKYQTDINSQTHTIYFELFDQLFTIEDIDFGNSIWTSWFASVIVKSSIFDESKQKFNEPELLISLLCQYQQETSKEFSQKDLNLLQAKKIRNSTQLADLYHKLLQINCLIQEVIKFQKLTTLKKLDKEPIDKTVVVKNDVSDITQSTIN